MLGDVNKVNSDGCMQFAVSNMHNIIFRSNEWKIRNGIFRRNFDCSNCVVVCSMLIIIVGFGEIMFLFRNIKRFVLLHSWNVYKLICKSDIMSLIYVRVSLENRRAVTSVAGFAAFESLY